MRPRPLWGAGASLTVARGRGPLSGRALVNRCVPPASRGAGVVVDDESVPDRKSVV